MKSIDGVSKIKDGYNPATWMLEITTPAQEVALGVDFTELYKNSDLYRFEPGFNCFSVTIHITPKFRLPKHGMSFQEEQGYD